MKFSIIITSYNYETYIVECLESCLNQSHFSDYEVILIDDGSTDNTRLLLSKYLDEKLSVYFLENNGIEKASNFGILKSKGEFVIRVDADDKLDETFLYEMNKYINDTNYDFFYSNYSIIDSSSKVQEEIILPQFDKTEILSRGDFLATGTVYRRDILFKTNFYETTVKNSGLENFELIIKIILGNSKGRLVSNSLFYYRRHQSNMSEIRKTNIIEYGNNLFNKFNLGLYRTNAYHPYKLKIN
jgi:glycosyltransferase involved in cell wall biosynthesis